MEDNRKPPIDVAKDMVKKASKKDAILIACNAIDIKRQEKPSSMMTVVWVEELEYLKQVKECLERMQ